MSSNSNDEGCLHHLSSKADSSTVHEVLIDLVLDLALLVEWLESMILRIVSNLNDSVILWYPQDKCVARRARVFCFLSNQAYLNPLCQNL